jgi:hypothetical protein
MLSFRLCKASGSGLRSAFTSGSGNSGSCASRKSGCASLSDIMTDAVQTFRSFLPQTGRKDIKRSVKLTLPLGWKSGISSVAGIDHSGPFRKSGAVTITGSGNPDRKRKEGRDLPGGSW